MPPKSAAELALQQKYELLRKKKQQQQAAQKAPEPTQPPVQSKEDAARAAAVKALQARRAAEERAAAAAATAKPAAGSQSPAGVKLKFVIPKKSGEAADAAPPGPKAKPSGDEGGGGGGGEGSKKAAAHAAAAAAQAPAPAAPCPASAPAASAPTAVPQPEADKGDAQDGAALKRPSTTRRPTAVRRPAQQQAAVAAVAVAAGPAGRAGQAGEGLPADEYAGPGGGEGSYEEEPMGAGGYADAGYEEQGRGYADRGRGYEEQGRGYEELGSYEEQGRGYEDPGRTYEDHHGKRRREEEPSGRERENTTLFVGDLPSYWASKDLDAYLSQFGGVQQARVMGSQCYGFVTFSTRQEAEALLDSVLQQPLYVEGHGTLRINWSQGSMPEWKKGPAIIRPRAPGEGPHGLESYEHPRVREARLTAQAMISQQELAAVHLAGPPPEREVVAYDDL